MGLLTSPETKQYDRVYHAVLCGSVVPVLLHLQSVCDLTPFFVLKFGKPAYSFIMKVQEPTFSQYTACLPNAGAHFEASIESDLFK